MRKALFPILCVLCVVLYSCKDNVVCPAFQSTYILSDSIRMAKYSLFLNDSTPKMTAASRRTKYGINKKSTLFEKNYDLKTAPKINVLEPKKPESEVTEDQGVFLADDFIDIDSLGGDSVSMAPMLASIDNGPKYKYRYTRDSKFNQEQIYYNKYYGELFINKGPAQPKPLLEENKTIESNDSIPTATVDSLQIETPPKKVKVKKEKKEKKKKSSENNSSDDTIGAEAETEPLEEETDEATPADEGN